ncbi:MAG: DPP IV N-terminal domain-containing protein, partial [Cyclobacteriaceae bacterium]|nr:DPP IV N-terminal domain-containing protein [Cyclobacteriaceae bacterium]
MKKLFSFLIFSLVCILTYGQSSELSVKKIMQDPKGWVGTSPSNITWADDSKTLYFEWNPDQNPGDSLYKISAPWKSVERVTKKEANTLPDRHFHYTKDRRKKIYSKNGDIFLVDLKSSKILQITNTLSNESDPSFTFDEKAITFTSENNLFLWNMTDQSLVQLTDFRRGNEQGEKRETLQNQWLKNDQMGLIQVLSEKENARKQKEAYLESTKPDRPEAIYTGSGNINQITLSPDRKYITYSLYKRAKTQGTIVPDYVTESGYTEDINARSKVGDDLSDLEVWIYDIENKKVYQVQSAGLPGLNDQPDYTKDYRNSNEKEVKREVYTHSPIWSDNGKNALISFRSKDNKDRWIGLLNIKDGSVKVLDRQRDEAWIGGPGIGWSFSTGDIGWMPDDEAVWFQSEESGYSHLYSVNISSGKKKALTKGDYEIFSPRISRDKKWWYFEANPDHPGIKNVYSMPIQGGDLVPITSGSGGNIAYFSPDE